MDSTKVEVYFQDLNKLDVNYLFLKYESFFDEERKQRISEAKSEKRKKELIVSGALLCKALKLAPGEKLFTAAGEKGKPYLPDREDLYYNISHSGDYVLLCLSGQETGIDIQKKVRNNPRLFERISSEEEKKVYSSDDLTLLFAIKEAYTKLTGLGLSKEMKEITFSEGNNKCFEVFDCGRFAAKAYKLNIDTDYEAFAVFKNQIDDIEINNLVL